MSLNSVTKRLEQQRLLEELRLRNQAQDSGTESDEDGHSVIQCLEYTAPHVSSSLSCSSSSSVFSSSKNNNNNCDSNCDIDDHYSSEEELKEIIEYTEPNKTSLSSLPATEKRKWSEMNESAESQTTPCLTDFVMLAKIENEERVDKRSSTPVQFHTSPPRSAVRPWKSPSPKLFQLKSSEDYRNDKRNEVSSNKRHRLTPHNIQRPCLDFEKMQQIKKRVVTSWRPQGSELSLFCW